MKIYRYMKFEELKDICENKVLKFSSPTVWKDSLESIFIKCFENKEGCKNLINVYKNSYFYFYKEHISDSNLSTDLKNILSLILKTYCKCFTVCDSNENFLKYDADIFVEFEFSDSDSYSGDFKVKGHQVNYIENLELDYIVNHFNKDRILSDLTTDKNFTFSWENEYRLVATPMEPRYLSKCGQNSSDLAEYLVDYYKFLKGNDYYSNEEIKIENSFLDIISVKFNPELSIDLKQQIYDLCKKYNQDIKIYN